MSHRSRTCLLYLSFSLAIMVICTIVIANKLHKSVGSRPLIFLSKKRALELMELNLFNKGPHQISNSDKTLAASKRYCAEVAATMWPPWKKPKWDLSYCQQAAAADFIRQLAPRQSFLENSKAKFFVEAGAHDGVFQSTTYHLEKFYGWHGLLIEPQYHLAREASRSRPNSVVFNGCLSSEGPYIATYVRGATTAKDLELVETSDTSQIFAAIVRRLNDPWQIEIKWFKLILPYFYVRKILCVPLEYLLEYSSVQRIGLANLDMEGMEYDIFRKFPFDSFPADMVQMEINKDLSLIQAAFTQKNFTIYGYSWIDALAIHNRLVDKIENWSMRERDILKNFEAVKNTNAEALKFSHS